MDDIGASVAETVLPLPQSKVTCEGTVFAPCTTALGRNESLPVAPTTITPSAESVPSTTNEGKPSAVNSQMNASSAGVNGSSSWTRASAFVARLATNLPYG